MLDVNNLATWLGIISALITIGGALIAAWRYREHIAALLGSMIRRLGTVIGVIVALVIVVKSEFCSKLTRTSSKSKVSPLVFPFSQSSLREVLQKTADLVSMERAR